MSKRILVIDDDKVIGKAFCLALEDTGFQVDTAELGKKGIEMEQSTGYDLIFLDLNMPELDGVETLRELRKIDERVPVYFITAFHRQFTDRLKALREEQITFELIEKPISRDRIVLVTKSILEGPRIAVERVNSNE